MHVAKLPLEMITYLLGGVTVLVPAATEVEYKDVVAAHSELAIKRARRNTLVP